jgi:hypothetical protein
MPLTSRNADVDHHRVLGVGGACAVYPAIADPCVGWDLVHRDWGARQRAAPRPPPERKRGIAARCRALAAAIANRLAPSRMPAAALVQVRTPCTCSDQAE